MPIFQCYNGPMVTTAAPTPVTTGTSLKTMLQIATPSDREIEIIAWGISFSGFAAAAPILTELVEVDAAATVTAHVASGIQKYDKPDGTASAVTLSTTGTGYSASAEGTVTASRYADVQQIAPSGQYAYFWPLGQEFVVAASSYLAVRVKAGTAVTALTWARWRE